MSWSNTVSLPVMENSVDARDRDAWHLAALGWPWPPTELPWLAALGGAIEL
jgi:hypothetical protein